jgi:hypothetical protein
MRDNETEIEKTNRKKEKFQQELTVALNDINICSILKTEQEKSPFQELTSGDLDECEEEGRGLLDDT